VGSKRGWGSKRGEAKGDSERKMRDASRKRKMRNGTDIVFKF
jgi:hypothetical protein